MDRVREDLLGEGWGFATGNMLHFTLGYQSRNYRRGGAGGGVGGVAGGGGRGWRGGALAGGRGWRGGAPGGEGKINKK